MVLPCTSEMVIMVLLNVALTCAMPELMFLRSFFRARGAAVAGALAEAAAVSGFAMVLILKSAPAFGPRAFAFLVAYLVTFFLPAIGFDGPLRVRALVCVRWPRTGRPLR